MKTTECNACGAPISEENPHWVTGGRICISCHIDYLEGLERLARALGWYA